MFFDVMHLILSFGYLALFAIIFSETGLLVGFFLPGDSLLFSAGMLASRGVLNIGTLMAVCFVAAIIGDSFGYYLGKRFGKHVFEREEPHFLDDHLNKENLDRTRSFFKKYGPLTIVVARFIPIIRTIAPTLAGAVEMDYVTFLAYNIVGGFSWVVSISMLGYLFGTVLPGALDFVAIIVVMIVAAPFAPMVVKHLNEWLKRQK